MQNYDETLKAYGLVNALLWAGIKVHWVVDITFGLQVSLIYPKPDLPFNWRMDLAAFFIRVEYTLVAEKVIIPWISRPGYNVNVYKLETATPFAVGQLLQTRPKVGILNTGGRAFLFEKVLTDAGFVLDEHFVIIDKENATKLDSVARCLTILVDPYLDMTTGLVPYVSAVRNFLENGGNFLAQSSAIRAYEQCGTTQPSSSDKDCPGFFMTDNGINLSNNNEITFNKKERLETVYRQNFFCSSTPDVITDMSMIPWDAIGSIVSMALYNETLDGVSNSKLKEQNFAYWAVGRDGTRYAFAAHAKLPKYLNDVGGNIFYISSYGHLNTSRALFFNAILHMASRPSDCYGFYNRCLENDLNETECSVKNVSTTITDTLANILFTLYPNHPDQPPCGCDISAKCVSFKDYSTGQVPPVISPFSAPIPPFDNPSDITPAPPLEPTAPIVTPPFAEQQTDADIIFGRIYLDRLTTTVPISLYKAVDFVVTLDNPSYITITFSDILSDSPDTISSVQNYVSNYARTLQLILNTTRITVQISERVAIVTIDDTTIPSAPSTPAPVNPAPSIPTNSTIDISPSARVYSISASQWAYSTIPIKNNTVDVTVLFSILSVEDTVIDIYILIDPGIDHYEDSEISTMFTCQRLGLSTDIGYWRFQWFTDRETAFCPRANSATLFKGTLRIAIRARKDAIYQLESVFTEGVTIPPYAQPSVPALAMSTSSSLITLLLLMYLWAIFLC
jgi:hypothetical protein